MPPRIAFPSPLALAIAAVLGLGCDAPPAEPAKPIRGVFLIVVDTLRADRLSCYGYPGHQTPAIDALAESGVRFANAQAAASWTVPSMGALLTSRLPAELGLVERPDDPAFRKRKRQRRRQRSLKLPAGPASLAEAFRAGGYRTGAFVDQPMLSPRHGFQRGFDDWFQPARRGEVVRHATDASDAARPQSWASTPFAYENDGALVTRFESWLEEQAEAPRLFAWLHLLTPHRPYDPPPETAGAATEPSLAERYDAEVRAADALVGRALRAIDAKVGLAHSIVAFTSDHGEAFGEHGSFEHGHSLHREVLHVPLVIAAPDRLRGGTHVDAVVALLDVAPTLLDLAGVDPPAGLRGASLRPELEGRETSRPVFAEGVLYGDSERAFLADGYKLLVDEAAPAAFLYAVGADPQERRNLAAEQPERVAGMRARMQTLRERTQPAAADAASESAEALEALRALGYAE